MGGADVTVTFPTGAVAPGAHEALLLNAGDAVLSRSPFWLYAAGTPPRHPDDEGRLRGRVSRSGCGGGPRPGTGSTGWACSRRGRGPAQNAEDCNAGSCGNGHYLLYDYTDTRIQGSTLIGPDSFAGYRTWPLKVGSYEIRLLMDDGYRLLAISNSFKIVHASS